MLRPFLFCTLGFATSLGSAADAADKKEAPMTPGGIYRAHDMNRPRPKVVTPPTFSTQDKPGTPPSDAIILFDGKDLSKWIREPRKDSPPGDDKPQWKVANGYAEIAPKSGGIRTREKFKGDYQLHIEWATPAEVSGAGQGRGNSGIFITGFPEIQVLDSHQNDTYPDGQAAGLYSNYPPMVNASRKPGEWQTYDILFERAKLDSQKKPLTKARLTVIHNGVVVHYLREFDSIEQEGDLFLQDHLNPVRYRNIWLRPLRVEEPAPVRVTVVTKATNEPPKGGAPNEKPSIFVIKTLTAQMKYDVSDFTVRPGESIKIVFENGDDLPHNFVLCQPGTDTAAMANRQMEKPEEAVKRNWLPDDKRILLHSRLLNPHEREVLTFTAPGKPGDYPYVCTFPGHALTMRGTMKVFPLGEGLKDLKYSLYLGAWDKLPDFNTLKPHREGDVPDDMIEVKLDDYKNEFGVVFTGKLEAPKTGSYRFYVSSDDGSRILIDGKEVLLHDGIHPASDIKDASCQLTKGPHEFRLEYFQKGGQIAVYAAWKGSSFDITPLSTWQPKGWDKAGKAKKKDFEPIPLTPKAEALIYRNFIAGAGNRAIAVGYPGGINIAWSAEHMNLELVWRGAFIDAARHWNSRGGGHEPPAGYDVLHPADGEPFTVLPSIDAAWPAPQERAPGFSWKGYRLDDQRRPTFMYDWKGVKVEDFFNAEGKGTAADGRLIRTLKFTGPVPQNTYLRLASGKIEPKGSGFVVDGGKGPATPSSDNQFIVSAKGAQIAGQQLLIPVKAGAEIQVTYSWLK